MKLYAKTIAQTLPDWATIVTKSADLIEIEINAMMNTQIFNLCLKN